MIKFLTKAISLFKAPNCYLHGHTPSGNRCSVCKADLTPVPRVPKPQFPKFEGKILK